MDKDERCCGTGTCLIDAEGLCWCGQQWNGSTMCRPAAAQASAPAHDAPEAPEAHDAHDAHDSPEADAAHGDAP